MSIVMKRLSALAKSLALVLLLGSILTAIAPRVHAQGINAGAPRPASTNDPNARIRERTDAMPTLTKPKRWNEEYTVEHPILDWLQTPELGWRFENQAEVNERYRTDEVEVLLLPILRERLKRLNPGVITDDARAEAILTLLRAERDNAEWIAWLRNEKT